MWGLPSLNHSLSSWMVLAATYLVQYMVYFGCAGATGAEKQRGRFRQPDELRSFAIPNAGANKNKR